MLYACLHKHRIMSEIRHDQMSTLPLYRYMILFNIKGLNRSQAKITNIKCIHAFLCYIYLAQPLSCFITDMFIATTLVKNNSDLMRMGHHGYQPAGGGGDGVLAVTSSSLSEIKV